MALPPARGHGGWRRPGSGLLAIAGVLACTSPDLAGVVFRCESNADCLAGRVCGDVEGVRACVPAAERPIEIGMTGPFRGPSGELAVELRRGIQVAFARSNADGGLFGRRLELQSRNDDFDPLLAKENVAELLGIGGPGAAGALDRRDPDGVFALLGSVGTDSALATAPLANENGVVLFSPLSGAHTYLRDGTRAPYIYNFRPGYFEETELLVEYMARQRQPRIISDPPGDSYSRLLVFAQDDAYGDAGYAGLVEAYNRRAPLPQPDPTQPNPSIRRIGYIRDDMASVDPAIAAAIEFLEGVLRSGSGLRSVGVVMLDTYQPGNQFIRAIKDWLNADLERTRRLDVLFSHLSVVGADSLATLLASPPASYPDVSDPARRRSYAEGVLVTQVVPAFTSESPGVAAYRADIDRFDGGEYGFTSLEGYLTARLFTDALGLCPELTSADLLTSLDTRLGDVDLGIGAKIGFSSSDHQASHTLWLSVLDAGGVPSVPFVWTAETGIRPN